MYYTEFQLLGYGIEQDRKNLFPYAIILVRQTGTKKVKMDNSR